MLASGAVLRSWRHLPQSCSIHQRHLHRTVLRRWPATRLMAPSATTAAAVVRPELRHPALCRSLYSTPTTPLHTTPIAPPYTALSALHTILTTPLLASTNVLHTIQTSRLHTTPPVLRQPRTADPDYETIYRFPYITTVRLICRLKIYQTALTLAGAPAAYLLHGTDAAAKVGALGLFAAGMLYVMGEFFRRFVGVIYLHRDGQKIKIAHLTFWGGRRDTVLPVEDIVPFSELKDSPEDVYFKLRRYSSKETFYVSLRYGGVSSRGKLEEVFGPIEER